MTTREKYPQLRNRLLLVIALLPVATFFACGGGAGSATTSPIVTPPPPPAIATTYTNPIQPRVSGGGVVESCPDPAIIHHPADSYWYVYCTDNPFNDNDKLAGNYRNHFISIHRTADFANWDYVGDAFTVRPAWVSPNAGLWAPNVEFLNGKYYLYYTVPATTLPGGSSAIGVATSNSPAGPWVDSGTPAVEPHYAQCCSDQYRWTIDSDVVEHNGELFMYYGSFYGGISVRRLSADGLRTEPASEVQITAPDRYEGAQVIKKNGFYYMFVSASDCCRGPLTGYAMFVGRAATPLGPFLDRDGNSLLSARAGGTLVAAQNGNRWVGIGHNAVFTDFAGQDWTVYHAVERSRPYFGGTTDTRRPLLMDAIDWVDGWPVLRGGRGPSEAAQPLPAAKANSTTQYRTDLAPVQNVGTADVARSDEFNTNVLHARWSWVRPPATGTRLSGTAFEFDSQNAELHADNNTASVLAQSLPNSDYIVETRMRFNLPAEGCCYNYAQAGLVVFADDNNYLKLVHVSIGGSRQIEFGKELSPVPAGYPRYGNTVLEAPAEWTYLRIMKRTVGGEEHYTAFSSTDGTRWTRGGTWTHALGANTRLGLISMSRTGFTAEFDYVRVYAVPQ